MKFAKQFEAQQVPEWRDVYCNFRHLKHLAKCIERQRSGVHHPVRSPSSRLSRRMSNFRRMLSGLQTSHQYHPQEQEDEMILIKPFEDDNTIEFETAFLGLSDELDRGFFRALDTELGKVNTFYQAKERELVNQAGTLDKQMEALIAAKQDVEEDASYSHGRRLEAFNGELNRRQALDTVDEDESGSGTGPRVVRIDIPASNPTEALASIFGELASKSLTKLSVRRVKKAEEMLKEAFVQFYQALCLMKNYSSINIIAFSKALKKYDKVTGRELSRSYLKAVESSYIGRSEKIQKLLDKVELLFTKYFADSDHQSAMQQLRPVTKRDRHRTTFFLGFFGGCTFSLLLALILTIRMERLYADSNSSTYMDAVFPLFRFVLYFGYGQQFYFGNSMLAAVLLHLYLYGLDVYLWRRTRVNHTFILGLERKTELSFRDVLLFTTGLSTFALCGMIIHLQVTAMRTCCQGIKEAIPLVVIAVPLAILFLPFNIFYRSTRMFFLTCILHCILAPFYKVIITDFLLADQLTSQVQALRDFVYVMCYYPGGFFKERNSQACTKNTTFITLALFVALLPYWCRFMQCLRRWYDEKDKMHVYNAMKFFSAILAVGFRIAYNYQKDSTLWVVLTIIFSVIATIASTYWDLVIDWGLLSRNAVNPWLREKLIVRYKSVYYFSMVTNVILRFAWLQTLLEIELPNINPKAVTLMVACLEVIRRGQWNFYRLENEHLNNVGKFRAVKSVPLPFAD